MTRDRSLDIAVIGVSARFPGAADLDGWWSSLLAGEVLTTRLDPQELIDAGVPEDLVRDPDYVPVRGHLADADRFDDTLLRVSPRDAEMMDPQHRLMLETAWTALEDAGVAPVEGPARSRPTTTAVFASGSGSGYLRSMLASGPLDPAVLDQALHGAEPDFIAGLISYKLGLTGPAVAVQTACSSGLVAVHLAAQALQNGDCDQAVVVAAGIDFPQAGHLHLPGGIQSVSGDCRPFDDSADGVVAGSGVACVVLRLLADVRDGSGPEPYGVILGTAINNDGAAKAGYFAPSVIGQEAVIRAALRAADVDAGSLGYLETHGTGTRVGDPIEWSAASSALAVPGTPPGRIPIGALKANTGHLDAAAGLAALIKALLVVRDGTVAPMAGFRRLNPLLESDGSPLRVPTAAEPWSGPLPRRAGVSAFGIGGTNAHVVIEQAPPRAVAHPAAPGPRLVLVSAADPAALVRSAARLADHLATRSCAVADVAATLATGRAELDHRTATTGRTPAEAADHLSTGRGTVSGSRPGRGPAPLVVLFPGQGTQYPGMAGPYARALPGFPAAMDACLAAADPDLAALLRAALLDPGFPAAELYATELAQPALFVVGYAAATALSALGLAPVAVLGHSLGEITAACVAGILDLPDAVRLVVARGRAMQACPAGAMLALGCDEDSALALVAGSRLELAAVNTPESCVVAGPIDEVEELRIRIGDRLPTRRLRTVRAFHTALVGAAVPALAAALDGVELHRPALPIGAGATGWLVPAGAAVGPELFTDGARRPVRFADALAAMVGGHPGAVAVEVGPGRALSAMAEAAGLPTVALSPARTAEPEGELLLALGELWTLGQPLDTAAVCGRGTSLHLPGYPFAGPRRLAPETMAPGPDRRTAETPEREAGSPVSPVSAGAVLAGLWAELLGRTDLTADSDFFDLGGDSLLVTHLARRVGRELGVTVPLRELLVSRTLGRQTEIAHDLVAAAGPAL